MALYKSVYLLLLLLDIDRQNALALSSNGAAARR